MERIELTNMEYYHEGDILIIMDGDTYVSKQDIVEVLEQFKEIQHLVAVRVYRDISDQVYLPIINIDGTFIAITDQEVSEENKFEVLPRLAYFRYYNVSEVEAGFEWEKEAYELKH